jgi:hypothetical protein
MIHRSFVVVACIAIALSSPSPASCQEPGKEGAAKQQKPQEPQEVEFTVPSKPEEAVAVDVDEMHEKIKGLPPGKLATLLGVWMSHVDRQQTALKAALSADKGSDERKRADAIGSDRDALIARAEAVIEILVKKGGDVARARKTIANIRTSDLERIVAQSTVPQDRTTAQDLDVDVLQAQLRPLTKEQVENQLKEWMALLQKQCLEVRKVEVASMASDDAESIDKYNARAVELRYQRDALIRRVEAVIAAFKEKGGDVKDAQAYVDSVVAAPQITGLRATWTTFRAWLVNPEGGTALAKAIAFFIIILIAFRILGGILASLLDRAMRSMKNSSELLRTFFVNTTRKLTILIGLVVALSQLGVNIGPLLAAIGAAGFVLGFALQGTLSNFAAGLMLLMYRPYNLGDLVTEGGWSEPGVDDDQDPRQQDGHRAQQHDLGGCDHQCHRQPDPSRRHGLRYRLQRRHRQGRSRADEHSHQPRAGVERSRADCPGARAGGLLRQLRGAAVGSHRALLGRLLGYHPHGEAALRRRTDLHSIPAAGHPRSPRSRGSGHQGRYRGAAKTRARWSRRDRGSRAAIKRQVVARASRRRKPWYRG